jgi:hypothetical protein
LAVVVVVVEKAEDHRDEDGLWVWRAMVLMVVEDVERVAMMVVVVVVVVVVGRRRRREVVAWCCARAARRASMSLCCVLWSSSDNQISTAAYNLLQTFFSYLNLK